MPTNPFKSRAEALFTPRAENGLSASRGCARKHIRSIHELDCECDWTERVGVHDARMDRIDRLLTPRELAVYLDVPLTTLYAWRYRGEGPAGFRVGKHLRYRWSDIEHWISERVRESESNQR